MSEPMALERLVEQLFVLRGFWTRTRVPIRTDKGSYSDLDVLAWGQGRVVVVECKGVGTSDEYRPLSARKWTEDTVRKFCSQAGRTFSLQRSPDCVRLGLKTVDEVYFVLPGFFERPEDKEGICRPYAKNDYKITLHTIDDVLRDLWTEVASNFRGRGRRYNDTSLELMRWMFRSRERVDWPAFMTKTMKGLTPRRK